jgi:DNA-binding Lrp family transcriptional regulator
VKRIQEKIFMELDRDARMPLTKLAKKLSISPQVVDYNLKALMRKEDYKLKFGTIINLKSLGLEQYRIFFNFNAHHDYQAKEVFNFLRNREDIYWASRIGGKYDLLAVIFVKDFEEVDQFIDEINKKFPRLIRTYNSSYVVNYFIYRHKYLSHDLSKIEYGYNDPIMEIDELDYYILSKMKDNCRISALELSKGQNVSYKTIINRIKNLEKNKVILGYRPFMKTKKRQREAKKQFAIIMSFENYSKGEEKKLLAYAAAHKSITQVLRMFGLWNLFIHVRAYDFEEVQSLVIELRDKFDITYQHEIIVIFEDIAINLMPAKYLSF